MKVQFSLDGMLTPNTEVEIGGSIYFLKNHYSPYYQLDLVVIEGGRLCLYFRTTDDIPQNLMVRRNYIKLYSHVGSVGLVVLSKDTHGHDDAELTYDVVTCEPDEDGRAVFHHRRFEATIEYPRCCNLNCNVSKRYLLEQGFACVQHEVHDGHDSIEVFSAGPRCWPFYSRATAGALCPRFLILR